MGVLSLAQIMDQSVGVVRKYIKTILAFALIYGVILFTAIIIIAIAGGIFIAVASPSGAAFSIAAAAILVLLITAVSLSYNVGIIKIASQEVLGEVVYAHHALGASFKNILRVAGVAVSGTLMFLPVAAIFAVPSYFLYSAIKASAVFVGMYGVKEILLIIVTAVAAIAAFALILAYITWFVFSLQAIAIEKKGVFAALKRSFELVRRSFWKTFGCFLLFALTVYAVRLSLDSFAGLVMAIVYLISYLLNMQQDFTLFITTGYSIFSWPLSIISWLVISPMGTFMMTFLYFNRRFQKEGLDMTLRLKELEKTKERKQTGEIVE